MTIDTKFVEMIKRGNYIVIDVETTGKERTDVICEVAITDPSNIVLLRQRINPKRPISADATRIHGITDDDVKNAPLWIDVSMEIIDLMAGKDVVIFNAKHERMLFHQSDEQAGITHQEWKNFGFWWCVMEFYAEVWGEPNPKFPNAKWQSLKNAITQQGLEPGMFHSALEDCFMTNELCRFIANNPTKVRTFANPVFKQTAIEITHDVKRVILDKESEYDELARLLSLGYQVACIARPPVNTLGVHCCNDEAFLTRKL